VGSQGRLPPIAGQGPVEGGSLTPRRGQLLGEGWQVGTQVSSGGQGQVWAVTDRQTSEKCAAKVFRIKGYEEQRLARAKVEIEAIKKLRGSTNVVQVRDENISRAEPGSAVELFYVMDFAAHGSLADNDFYIGDVEQCLRLFREILLGVREAHRKGVIHRDLKPANILLYPTQRQVVITDFGLGLIKDREADEKITEPDELLGPRFFMAPEQYVRPSDANERSDIYSLGKILYYMLTGRGKVFREQLNDIDKELKEPNPYIPQVQELLLNRMVAEKPDDRFIDVDEVIDAVERITSQIAANSQRYLKPNTQSENVFVMLAGSQREMLIQWFSQNIVLAIGSTRECGGRPSKRR
jgi:serine/threonine protein kinase